MATVLLVATLSRLTPPVVRRLLTWRAARAPVADAAVYFDAVAGELRRGAALRQALAIAAPQTRLARLAATGQPLELVAAEVHSMFALDDELVAAGIRLAGRSGAPAAVLFTRLAERLRAAEQLVHNHKTLTAQARLSAVVIGLLPVAPTVIMAASSRGGLFLEPGPARSVILLGFALQMLGLIVIGGLLRADR